MPILGPPAAGGEIWQGDIYEGVPGSLIQGPLFVKETGKNPETQQLLYEGVQPPDLGKRNPLIVQSGVYHAMLLTHECVMDKKDPGPVTMARVLPLNGLPVRMQETVREGRFREAFWLPECDELEESFVDFRMLSPVHINYFRSFNRIASLTDDGRASLRASLFVYFCRAQMTERLMQLIEEAQAEEAAAQAAAHLAETTHLSASAERPAI